MRIRCTVESMNYSACGMQIGDYFEVDERGLSVPDGHEFCWFAIASVVPLISGRIGGGDPDWLRRRPLVACPDPPEGLHMRLEVLDDDAG
jgi:uncharacterized repeat protein (TIGR04076 family)